MEARVGCVKEGVTTDAYGPLFTNRETPAHPPKGRRRSLLERRSPREPIYVSREFGLTPGDDRLKG